MWILAFARMTKNCKIRIGQPCYVHAAITGLVFELSDQGVT